MSLTHARLSSATAIALVALASTGCASSGPAVVAPLSDAPRTAGALQNQTGLQEPVLILFEWWLSEEGQRFEGDGYAQVEPPNRARLDLYLDNGETVAAAVLVENDLRLGLGTYEDVLPPADLMWGVVGVFRPQPGSRLLGGDELEDGSTRLRYQTTEGDEIRYVLLGDRLRSVEVFAGGSVVQRLELDVGDGERYPEEVRYRNLAEYRELRLRRTELEPSEPFDDDIWDPTAWQP